MLQIKWSVVEKDLLIFYLFNPQRFFLTSFQEVFSEETKGSCGVAEALESLQRRESAKKGLMLNSILWSSEPVSDITHQRLISGPVTLSCVSSLAPTS